ncbi:helicase [Shewanella sairae]|uniref:Helicase n=1 Tax=Shewanella sairae TaxID=190310 RepID=A0ABQ4P5H7_9GAMM|nr:MobH family relaxase [Shewanella sairae]MCL1130445.1 TraI domain-containing protein [Shewanella sairae]GIU42773.1 helicase [Shewanella sairae]
MSIIKKLKSLVRQEPTATVSFTKDIAPEGYFLPWTEKQIREDDAIKEKLRVLKRSGLALPYEIWDDFVVNTVINFALWAQDFPASASYHHHGKKGLIFHSLDVAIYAMRIRRNYIMPPNVPPEDVIHREIMWAYGVFLAALFHDSGKIMDFDVELRKDKENTTWTPPLGPIGKLATPYRFKYKDDRAYLLSNRSGLSFLMQVVQDDPMVAITSDSMLFGMLSQFLTGHSNPDNVIEQIIKQADAASISQDLGGTKEDINLAAKKVRFGQNALAEQLHTCLTYLLTEQKILLNTKGATGFVNADKLYLVCDPIADLIRETLVDRGVTDVPTTNPELFAVLLQHKMVCSTPLDSAVWKIKVTLTDIDWYQHLGCLCIHLPSFIPDLSFKSLSGSIDILLDETAPVVEESSTVDVTEQVAHNETAAMATVDTPIAISANSPVNDDLLMSLIPGMGTTEVLPSIKPIETNSAVSAVAINFDDLTEEAVGELFWSWVESGITSGELTVNQGDSVVHVVQGHLLITSPSAMKLFCVSMDQLNKESYMMVQAGFIALGLHIKTKEGRTIHTINVSNSAPISCFVVELNDALKALELADYAGLEVNFL